MIETFLKAKHWQLFLLTFGIPLLIQFTLLGTMFADIGNGTDPDPSLMLNYLWFFPFLMIIFTAVLYGWQWSIAIGLQSKIPDNVIMKVRKFKLLFVIPLVYFFFLMMMIGATMSEISITELDINQGIVGSIVTILIPLHLFSIFCLLYVQYFVAKTLKTAELKRSVRFSDFAGEFFMIWFYPIGIWILQPRINKLIQ